MRSQLGVGRRVQCGFAAKLRWYEWSSQRLLVTGASLLIQSAMSVGGVFAGTLLSSVVAVADHLPRPSSVQCRDLFERLRMVGDGRSDVGRSHPVAAVLTLAAAAVVGGMRSYAAIAGWVADTPSGPVGQMYAGAGWRRLCRRSAPSGGWSPELTPTRSTRRWAPGWPSVRASISRSARKPVRRRRADDRPAHHGRPRRRRQTDPRRHRREGQRPAPAGRGDPRRRFGPRADRRAPQDE